MPPPGGYVTIILMGFVGYSAAVTGAAIAKLETANNSARAREVFMLLLQRLKDVDVQSRQRLWPLSTAFGDSHHWSLPV
jgi:hypothetical protein